MTDTDRLHRWSAEQWKAISPYLDEALDLQPGERERWLDGLSLSNPALASDVRELLITHEKINAAQFLDGALLRPVPDAHAGQRLGAYALESLIGSGSLGSVWVARQEGAVAKVAIKILDQGGLNQKSIEQIRREASVLGKLSHPHLAGLIDVGFAGDTQAYLIMEYVEGAFVDGYCDANSLPPDARLALMLRVIDAVAHAHAQGLVHRELKPSNIRVTAQGIPKVLDLGVASLIRNAIALTTAAVAKTAPLNSAADAAATGMAPIFASPEQVRGEPATPASDVYALGILLHLIITGRHPLVSDTSTHTEIIRAVLTEEPGLASEALESAPSREWARGELDAVIAKASRREPENRYADAAELAADLRRFRGMQPVWARRHTWAQRIGMFARRRLKTARI